MDNQGNFCYGFLWGAAFSIVLWIAFFGWLKLMLHFLL